MYETTQGLRKSCHTSVFHTLFILSCLFSVFRVLLYSFYSMFSSKSLYQVANIVLQILSATDYQAAWVNVPEQLLDSNCQ